YATEHPVGKYATQAKERMKALSANITDTIKIKSERELAQLKDAEDSYQQAIKLQKDNKYDDALALYQKAMSLNPKESAYIYGTGTLYQQKGDIDQAIKWYQQAIDLDKTNKMYSQMLEQAFDLKAQPLVDQAYEKFKANDFTAA